MKKLILLLCILSLMSCATQKMPYRQAKKEWYCPPKKKYKPKTKISHEGNSFIHHGGSTI